MARQCKSHCSVLTKYSHEIQRWYPLSFAQKGLACLFFYRDGRYLLIMTENFAALPRIKQLLLEQDEEEPYVIFGSGFPKDQLFTQVKIMRYMSHVTFTLSACVSVYYLCHGLYHLITACISLCLMSLSLCLPVYLPTCLSVCLSVSLMFRLL